MTLHFVIFDVEAGGTECSKDKVTIFDGSEISTPVLGSFCGNQLPRNITTKQNAALVTFSADSEIAASGFWVQYFIHIEGTGATYSQLMFAVVIGHCFPFHIGTTTSLRNSSGISFAVKHALHSLAISTLCQLVCLLLPISPTVQTLLQPFQCSSSLHLSTSFSVTVLTSSCLFTQ